MDWKEWFEKQRHIYDYPPSNHEERRYQAYKARFASECPLMLFPREPLDCHGVSGDLGKIDQVPVCGENGVWRYVKIERKGDK